jgi:hypothetical protein
MKELLNVLQALFFGSLGIVATVSILTVVLKKARNS